MIPYAILSGVVSFSDRIEENLEIRVIDLAPDYFTFRLPLAYVEKLQEITHITLHFFTYEEQAYRRVDLKNYIIAREEHADFWVLLRVSVEKDKEYGDAVCKLSKEYLTYMERKLYLSDVELSASMTEYPEDQEEDYVTNEQEQIRLWVDDLKTLYDMNSQANIEGAIDYLSILLDQADKVSLYLENDLTTFQQMYWEQIGLSWHPYAKEKIKGIHFGNAFCPNLLPEIENVEKMIEKAKREHLHCTLVIPPVSQSIYGWMIAYLDQIHKICDEIAKDLDVECNDEGMKRYLARKKKEANSFRRFRILSGILLHKKTRDPRMKYRRRLPDQSEGTDLKIGDDLNIIEKITDYDQIEETLSMRERISLDNSDTAIYAPLYQTNTATFCTLHAILERGSRGLQHRVLSCKKECLHSNYLYPKHLKMLGRYNSLFGFAEDSFLFKENIGTWGSMKSNPTDDESVNNNIGRDDQNKNSIEWMVINL